MAGCDGERSPNEHNERRGLQVTRAWNRELRDLRAFETAFGVRIAARGRARFKIDWAAVDAFRQSCVGAAWLIRERDAGRASAYAVAPLRELRRVVDERLTRVALASLAWVATAQHAYGGAAFIVPHAAMGELLGCSEATAKRAMWLLVECGLLARVALYRPRDKDKPTGDRARCECAYALGDLAKGFIAAPVPRAAHRNTPGHFAQASQKNLISEVSETQTRACARGEVEVSATPTVDRPSAAPDERTNAPQTADASTPACEPSAPGPVPDGPDGPDPELIGERVATEPVPELLSERRARTYAERAAVRASAIERNRTVDDVLANAFAAWERKFGGAGGPDG